MIKSAQVYYTLDGYFHVEITQRKPVLRIMSGEGYYVDEDGKIMPLSRKYTSRVVVATGNISRKFACNGLYPFIMTLRMMSSGMLWWNRSLSKKEMKLY